jgi:transcription elongation factor Elf1
LEKLKFEFKSDYNLKQMGKRKKTKRRIIKTKQKELKTVFDCPFCNHKGSVNVKK